MSVNKGNQEVTKFCYKNVTDVQETVNKYFQSKSSISTKIDEIYHFRKVHKAVRRIEISPNDTKPNKNNSDISNKKCQLTIESNINKPDAMDKKNKNVTPVKGNDIVILKGEKSLEEVRFEYHLAYPITHETNSETFRTNSEKDLLKKDNWRLLTEVFSLQMELSKCKQQLSQQKKEMDALLKAERKRHKELKAELEQSKSNTERTVDLNSSKKKETEDLLEAEREKYRKLKAEQKDLISEMKIIKDFNTNQKSEMELLLKAEHEKNTKLTKKLQNSNEKMETISELNIRLQKSILYYGEKLQEKEKYILLLENKNFKEQSESLIGPIMKMQRNICTIC